MRDELLQAYVNGNISFSQGNIYIGDHEIVMIEMKKAEVLSKNIERLRKLLEEQSKKNHRGFSSVVIAIQGWDDTPEPIYEIMEIRRFYRHLYKKIPHFLFYVAPFNNIDKSIIACLADIEVKARHGEFKSPIQLAKENKLGNEGPSTTAKIRLDEMIAYDMIQSIEMHAVKIGLSIEDVVPLLFIIEGTVKEEQQKYVYIPKRDV